MVPQLGDQIVSTRLDSLGPRFVLLPGYDPCGDLLILFFFLAGGAHWRVGIGIKAIMGGSARWSLSLPPKGAHQFHTQILAPSFMGMKEQIIDM